MEISKIQEILFKQVKQLASIDDELELDTNLEGVVDSTAIMEFVLMIEESFGFGVELEDINSDNFGSVRQLSQWVDRNINAPMSVNA